VISKSRNWDVEVGEGRIKIYLVNLGRVAHIHSFSHSEAQAKTETLR
jgi:hypothetical protein